MKTLYILIISFLITVSTLTGANFSPAPGTPIANGEHPRIFVTASDINPMRTRIANYYMADFQQLVNHMDNHFYASPGTAIFAETNDIFGAAQSYALLYLVDPATIPGISAAHSKNEYGRRALEFGLFIAENLPDDWREAHHGPSMLTSKEGGVASLALQVVYDWTYPLSTLAQRKRIVNRLLHLWNNRYASKKVKLENHFAANVHVYAGALCFYGDKDLGTGYIAQAKAMMDSFQDVYINRQLEVSERIFEGSSDWIEGDSYSLDAYVGLMFLAGAASSAIGQDLFTDYSWLHYAPYYIYYNIVPMNYKGNWYFTQQNTSRGMSFEESGFATVMNMCAAKLKDTDPDMASFAAWFCEESKWGMQVDDFQHYQPHLQDFYYKFMFGTKHVETKTPEQLKIPLSTHLGQMHVMQSDYSYNDKTLIQFYAQKYCYPNGHNELEMGAININRFGTLAIAASKTKNGLDGIPRVENGGSGYAMNNVLGIGNEGMLNPHVGKIIASNSDTPDDFVTGAVSHVGTVEAREYKANSHDYINYNYTRSYKGDLNVSLARRGLVYLRGKINHEYIVVLDRVETAKDKKFILHLPVKPEPINGNWGVEVNNFAATNAKQVKVTNRIDQAHGQMVVTSVFPEDATIHQAGGPGKEWLLADGTPLVYDGEYNELGSYLMSDHTLQIRSKSNQFITVMQIGDANTFGDPASVEKLQGPGYNGVFLGKERVVIFSESESKIENITYRINANQVVKHLVTELPAGQEYTLSKAGKILSQGTVNADGAVSFADNPSGDTHYTLIIKGKENAAASISVAPVSLDFGTVLPGFSLSKKIAISNPNQSMLNITEIAFVGTNSEKFSMNTVLPGSIAPGDSHFVTVTVPDSEGEYEVSLQIKSNLGSKTVPLKGCVQGTVPGDVDLDGEIKTVDADSILAYLVGLKPLNDPQKQLNAKVSPNTSISAWDASLIRQYVRGSINSLPYNTIIHAKGTIAMAPMTVKPGETFVVTPKLQNGKGIYAFQAVFSYDTTYMELQHIDWKAFGSFSPQHNSTNHRGEIHIAGANATAIQSDEFVSLHFKLKKAIPGRTFISLTELHWNGGTLLKDPAESSIEMERTTSLVSEDSTLPNTFDLSQNYPNPFNPSTTIRFSLPQTGRVELAIFNMVGQKVRTLVKDELSAGTYQRIWDATDDYGREVSSGLYVYRLYSATGVQQNKMLYLK
ncbi:MAG: T9SS C-terminal target domain-containing protein [Calditrichaeota bacterium]|nr:MAG: T9SS C-terminal target domain-containing protein [Calditrichota bacterium]